MKNDRIRTSWERIELSRESNERMLASLLREEAGRRQARETGIRRKRWLIPVLILSALLVLGTAAYAASTLIRRAEPYEIHHKVEGYDYYGGIHPKQYLDSRVLPSDQDPVVTVYPEGELLADHPPNINTMDNFSNFCAESVYYLLGTYPTPNVRKVENGENVHYYVMYMTEKGARYYLFYDKNGYPYGYPVYLTAWHERREFEGLKAGDPIEKVERIDPTASVYRSYFRTFEQVEGNTAEEKNEKLWDLNQLYFSYPLAGVHYLKDGLLEIRYEFDDDGRYVVKSLYYDPDYRGIVPELELFVWPDLSMWSEDSREEVMKSYEEYYASLVNTDFGYRILPQDEPNGEKVIADIEPETHRETLAEEVDWILPVTVKNGSGERRFEFTADDFTGDEILTVTVSRRHAGESSGGIETIFAGGIPLLKLAEKAGIPDFRQAEITVEGGEKLIFTREELIRKHPVAAWIRNKKYAMDHSETGLSLAIPEADVESFRFSIQGIEFTS